MTDSCDYVDSLTNDSNLEDSLDDHDDDIDIDVDDDDLASILNSEHNPLIESLTSGANDSFQSASTPLANSSLPVTDFDTLTNVSIVAASVSPSSSSSTMTSTTTTTTTTSTVPIASTIVSTPVITSGQRSVRNPFINHYHTSFTRSNYFGNVANTAVCRNAFLPWLVHKESQALLNSSSSSSSINVDLNIRPGEFVMCTLFADFTLQAERKIEIVMAELPEKSLAKVLQRGEDSQFDQLVLAFGSVAEYCLPSLLRTLFSWYERQMAEVNLNEQKKSDQRVKSLMNIVTGTVGVSSGPETIERSESEVLQERRDLAVEFIFCRVLTEVLKKLPFHPGHEDLVTYIENLAIKHFRFKECSQSNVNATNLHIVADLYAEVIGVVASSRYMSVRKRFTAELKDLRNREPSHHTTQSIISLLMGMKFFRVKMVPIEEFEASFQFMHEAAHYFLEVKDKDIKHALAGLFVEILGPIADNAKNEVNVPCLKNFVEILYPQTLDLCTKSKHRLALFPLVTTLLCVSQKIFFLQNWHYFLAMCLSHLKNKDSKMSRVALESLCRLIWVYMIRIKCESNSATQSRLQSIVNSIFPKGSKAVVPRDSPLFIFVKIIQFISYERLDFAMREIVFDLLSIGRPVKIILTPERMNIGLRAFLVVADSLEQKEGSPPMPKTVAVLPSGNTLRVRKTFLNKMLTDDTAKSIGISSYFMHVRRIFTDILRALDAQYGKPLMMTSAANFNKDSDEKFASERKPRIDLFRTCIAAIPRLIPDGMTGMELVDLLARLTVHSDEELRTLAYQSLQTLLIDFHDWRQDVLWGFTQFLARDVIDTFPQLLDNGLRMLLQLLTSWRNSLLTDKETAFEAKTRNSTASMASQQQQQQQPSQSHQNQPQQPVTAVLQLIEAFALVMLCNYRQSLRKTCAHILRETKFLRDHHYEQQQQQPKEKSLLDVIDRNCARVMEKHVLPYLSGSLSSVANEKQAIVGAVTNAIIDLQWLADRTAPIWTNGFSYDDQATSSVGFIRSGSISSCSVLDESGSVGGGSGGGVGSAGGGGLASGTSGQSNSSLAMTSSACSSGHGSLSAASMQSSASGSYGFSGASLVAAAAAATASATHHGNTSGLYSGPIGTSSSFGSLYGGTIGSATSTVSFSGDLTASAAPAPDPWYLCFFGFLDNDLILSQCPSVVSYAWPLVYARINSLMSVIDPMPLGDNRASLLRSSVTIRKPVSERDVYINVWRNYVTFAFRVVPRVPSPVLRCASPDLSLGSSPESQTGATASGSAATNTTTTINLLQSVSPIALYKLIVPLLRCEIPDIHETVIGALGKINSDALKDLMDELVLYVREAMDRKQENVRRRRRRDLLRLHLIRVFELIAEYGTFGDNNCVVDRDTQSLHRTFVEYIDGARLSLEMELDKNSSTVQELAFNFCHFVRKMLKSFSIESQHRLLKSDLRRNLFALFAMWAGPFAYPPKAASLSGINECTELQLAALQAMSAVLCCGPCFDTKHLIDDGQLYQWLSMLLASKHQRIYAIACELVVLLLECNPDIGALLDWVVDKCYTGAVNVADSCFTALATVFSTREYPCDHYTAIINVALMNTGCARSAVQDLAFNLLQLLDRRFFAPKVPSDFDGGKNSGVVVVVEEVTGEPASVDDNGNNDDDDDGGGGGSNDGGGDDDDEDTDLSLKDLSGETVVGGKPKCDQSPSTSRTSSRSRSSSRSQRDRRRCETLDSVLAEHFNRSQSYLSGQLARLHPEITMPIFSEITHRFQTARDDIQQVLLQSLLPWLTNMELIDATTTTTATVNKTTVPATTVTTATTKLSDGCGSIEATEMVLNNLFYLTTKFADKHQKEIEDVWITLCTSWPTNMRVIVRYLIIMSGMSPNELLPHAKQVAVYLAHARAVRLVDEIMLELQTIETLNCLVERTQTPPFYRYTSMRKTSSSHRLDTANGSRTGTCSRSSDNDTVDFRPQPMLPQQQQQQQQRSSASEKGTIHTKRHSSEDPAYYASGDAGVDDAAFLPHYCFGGGGAAAGSQSIAGSDMQRVRRRRCCSVPNPLPMPEYGGYFAPLTEFLPDSSQPISGLHRCNIAVMLLTDVIADGVQVDFTIHLPLLLHIVFLSMDHNRTLITDHCKRLLLNLLVVLCSHRDHLTVSQIMLNQKTKELNLGLMGTYQPLVREHDFTEHDAVFDVYLCDDGNDNRGRHCRRSSAADIIKSLVHFLVAKRHQPLWNYEDITARLWQIKSAEQLAHFVQHIVRIFDEQVLFEKQNCESRVVTPMLRERWAQIALQYGLSCSSRHFAGRSMQIFRALRAPITPRMLSDILSRLVETVSEQGEDMQGYVTELLLTLEAVVESTESQFRSFDLMTREIFKSTPNLNKEQQQQLLMLQQMKKSPAVAVTGNMTVATNVTMGPVAVTQSPTSQTVSTSGHTRSTSCSVSYTAARRTTNMPPVPETSRPPTVISSSFSSTSSSSPATTVSTASLARSRSAQSLKFLSDPQTHDDKLAVLTQLFWLSVSLLESEYEHEFLLALRLLDRVLDRFPLDRPDARDKVDKLQAQLKWSNFIGVHALLLKGCCNASVYESVVPLLAQFTLFLDLPVVDPSQSYAFPMNVIALLPYLILHYEDANELCVRSAENIARVSSEKSKKLENLATVMTLYSRRNFNKESFQWTKCVVKYLYDTYAHQTLNMLTFLVEMLEKSSTSIQLPILNIIHCMMFYVDLTTASNQPIYVDLLRVVAKYIEGQHWKEALKVLKLVVTRSSTLVAPPITIHHPHWETCFTTSASSSSHSSAFLQNETEFFSKKELPGRTMDFTFDLSQTPVIGRRFVKSETYLMSSVSSGSAAAAAALNQSSASACSTTGASSATNVSGTVASTANAASAILSNTNNSAAKRQSSSISGDYVSAAMGNVAGVTRCAGCSSQTSANATANNTPGTGNANATGSGQAAASASATSATSTGPASNPTAPNNPNAWKKPWLAQSRVRECLVNLLTACGQRVGLPKSPSVIFSQSSDLIERQSSITSSTEEVSVTNNEPSTTNGSRKDDTHSDQFGVFKDFDFLEYESESVEGESSDNFNWGVRRQPLKSDESLETIAATVTSAGSVVSTTAVTDSLPGTETLATRVVDDTLSLDLVTAGSPGVGGTAPAAAAGNTSDDQTPVFGERKSLGGTEETSDDDNESVESPLLLDDVTTMPGTRLRRGGVGGFGAGGGLRRRTRPRCARQQVSDFDRLSPVVTTAGAAATLATITDDLETNVAGTQSPAAPSTPTKPVATPGLSRRRHHRRHIGRCRRLRTDSIPSVSTDSSIDEELPKVSLMSGDQSPNLSTLMSFRPIVRDDTEDAWRHHIQTLLNDLDAQNLQPFFYQLNHFWKDICRKAIGMTKDTCRFINKCTNRCPQIVNLLELKLAQISDMLITKLKAPFLWFECGASMSAGGAASATINAAGTGGLDDHDFVTNSLVPVLKYSLLEIQEHLETFFDRKDSAVECIGAIKAVLKLQSFGETQRDFSHEEIVLDLTKAMYKFHFQLLLLIDAVNKLITGLIQKFRSANLKDETIRLNNIKTIVERTLEESVESETGMPTPMTQIDAVYNASYCCNEDFEKTLCDLIERDNWLAVVAFTKRNRTNWPLYFTTNRHRAMDTIDTTGEAVETAAAAAATTADPSAAEHDNDDEIPVILDVYCKRLLPRTEPGTFVALPPVAATTTAPATKNSMSDFYLNLFQISSVMNDLDEFIKNGAGNRSNVSIATALAITRLETDISTASSARAMDESSMATVSGGGGGGRDADDEEDYDDDDETDDVDDDEEDDEEAETETDPETVAYNPKL